MKISKFSNQGGETQLGLMVGALILGTVIAVSTFITQYMSETMHDRNNKTQEFFKQQGKTIETFEPRRSRQGYSVVIK